MEIAVAVIFIVFLVLAALYISMQKKDVEEEGKMPVIHTSGIYSVIRKSPRENVFTVKPDSAAMKAFLASETKDTLGRPLSEKDREALLKSYTDRLEKSLKLIEDGDRIGVQRFIIRFGKECEPCRVFSGDRFYVTREDIFKHPELIPPYYAGCRCEFFSESEWKTVMNIEHFKPGANERFKIPHSKQAFKIG